MSRIIFYHAAKKQFQPPEWAVPSFSQVPLPSPLTGEGGRQGMDHRALSWGPPPQSSQPEEPMILRAVQGPSCLPIAWPLCLEEKGRASQPGLWWSSEGWGQPLLLESAMVVGPRSPPLTQPTSRHLSTQNSLGTWVPQGRDVHPPAGPSSSSSPREARTKFNPTATSVSQRDSQGSPSTHLCQHTHPCLLRWGASQAHHHHTPAHTCVCFHTLPWVNAHTPSSGRHTADVHNGSPSCETGCRWHPPIWTEPSRAHTHRCPRTLPRGGHTQGHPHSPPRVTFINSSPSPSPSEAPKALWASRDGVGAGRRPPGIYRTHTLPGGERTPRDRDTPSVERAARGQAQTRGETHGGPSWGPSLTPAARPASSSSSSGGSSSPRAPGA